MKKLIYSTLALICAITTIAISKANTNFHRTWWIYKYIGTYPVSTLHQITLTTNWTHVTTAPTCAGAIQACLVTATITPLMITGRIIPSAPIPAAQTVTGSNPRFTAATNGGVHTVKSKANQ